MAFSPAASGFACVIDSSALLAVFNEEPGAQAVEPLLSGSAISAVNWSEYVQKSLARGVNLKGIRDDADELGISILPLMAEDAETAALLWEKTRHAGLSLGDRCCLALARRLGVAALTADRAWARLSLEVQVQVIR